MFRSRSDSLPDHKDTEPDFLQFLMRQDVAPIKEEGRLEHAVINCVEIEGLELIPLSEYGRGMGSLAGLQGARDHDKVGITTATKNLGTYLGLGNLGIIDHDLSAFGEEVTADGNSSGLACVIGILLEGKAKDGDVLPINRVEEIPDNAAAEAGLLPVIHLHDALPIGSDLGKTEVLAEIGKVKDVLLEAGTAVAHGGLQELGTDAGVLADRPCNFINISPGGLAEGGD